MRLDRVDASAAAVAVAGHGALLAALVWAANARGPALPPSPPAIEVSFVEEIGPVAAGETTAPSAPPAAPSEPAAASEAAEPQPAEAPPPPSPLAVRQPQPRTPAARDAPPRRPLTEEALGGFGSDPAARERRPSGAVVNAQARASMDAAILRALLPCQRQVLPAPEARAIRVRVEVTLNPNGSLASARVLSVANDDPDLRIYERRMRELAVNVVEQCTPIRGLPAEYYNVPRGWRTFRYVFPNS